MKMAKASEKDIDAAGEAMGVLADMSRGYYPKREGDECDDLHFDPEDPAHLSTFYRLMTRTLDASPGWPGRVIGGMCYVVLYDANGIVNPDADTLELHPRFADMSGETMAQREEVCAAWHELPDELRLDPRMSRLYQALGGPNRVTRGVKASETPADCGKCIDPTGCADGVCYRAWCAADERRSLDRPALPGDAELLATSGVGTPREAQQ